MRVRMFMGIIRHIGRVRDVRDTRAAKRLQIDLGPLVEDLCPGDSVAVNGLCLTACEIRGSTVTFDVMAESLARSTLGGLRREDRVNLERALRAESRFDGHIVQGHVDGRARVRSIDRDTWTITFFADRTLSEQMVPKGSVAVDGVSLTVVDVDESGFSVALIPTTLAETTLGILVPGRDVNIEVDILGKYVKRTLQQMLAGLHGDSPGGLTIEKLRQAGFV